MAPPKGRVKAVAVPEELSDSEEEVAVSPKKAKSPVSNGEDAPEPAKRGRGRPKKVIKVLAPGQRGRGRPKKEVSDDEEVSPKPSKRKGGDDSDEAEPKGRGRPKKKVVPEDDEEDDEEEEETK